LLRELEQRALAPRQSAGGTVGNPQNEKQAVVSRLIQIYMNRGHLIAKVDPLGLMQRTKPKLMELGYMGLS
jgi:2-oxoglutarate dehydrogenase E1 component